MSIVFLLLAATIFQDAANWVHAAGNKSKVPPEVIMRRSQAGEPDPTGWSLAESTGGGFAVMVPGKYDDFTIMGVAPDGVSILSDIVESLTPEGSKFSAFRVMRMDGSLPAGAVDKIAEKIRRKNFYFKKNKRSFLGMEGFEIVAKNDTSSSVTRVFQGDGRIYELIVEYPSALTPVMERDINRFMESFTLH